MLHTAYDTKKSFYPRICKIKWDFINKTEKMITDLVYDALYGQPPYEDDIDFADYYFSEGLARVRKDGKSGFLIKPEKR